MKIAYELVIDERAGGLYTNTAADLLDFMAMLLRREALGGPVITSVGAGAGIPTGHTITCVAIQK